MSSIGKTLFLTFQSTFPIQGTTEGYINSGPVQEISIHVPYTGNDVNGFTQKQLADISIHVPYTGNDDIRRHYILILLLFQSTFPIQGTTRNEEDVCQTNLISIHVPYTGNDASGTRHNMPLCHFNPRSLYRERRIRLLFNQTGRWYFNPRSLYRERQQTYPNINIKQHYFRNILRFSFNIFSSLIYIVIQYSIFVQLFWCESPGIFMYTPYSHYQIAV